MSGFATALSSIAGSFLSNVFVTSKFFTVGVGTHYISAANDDGNIAFTRLSNIIVGAGSTIHVSAGTTFILNVLGIFT